MEEKTFGERLKTCRKAKGLTQQALAEKIGVSDKTVSRWESDGGYPDVPTLVPLARALGVTVDELLDDRRPVRTLTGADWQSLLSFGFALGGGVLFYLLNLFMPTLLCYLIYLGCLAYGVYLQKYYAYRSRWFLLGEAGMDLFVNLTLCSTLVRSAAGGLFGILDGEPFEWSVWLLNVMTGKNLPMTLLSVLLAVLLTVLTQRVVLQKKFSLDGMRKKRREQADP